MSVGATGNGTPQRVIGIGSAIAIMIAGILTVGPAISGRDEEAAHPPATPMDSPGPPIAAEADVFRASAAALEVEPVPGRREAAHPRTLATARRLRPYPGAPPRVPHGLTRAEFLQTRCNVCHERGGYVARFGTYAPVTPHPEYRQCLQCHVPEDVTVGIELPTEPAHVTCVQCHIPDVATAAFVALDWRPAPWPATGQTAMPGAPPAIPHGLELRARCVACHAGGGAVAEIRTTHPERANCRQCHVPAPAEEAVFTRPVAPWDRDTDGGP